MVFRSAFLLSTAALGVASSMVVSSVFAGPPQVSPLVATAVTAADEKDAEKPKAEETKKKDESRKTVKVAEIRLNGALPEAAASESLFGDATETFFGLIARFDKAAADKDVAGLIVHVGSPTVGRGKLYELREAIGRVRAAGKPVWAFMDSGDTVPYLLASAADKVYVPQPGVLLIPGVRAEVWFYKDLFDKLDITADMIRIGEFKSAAEPYTNRDMSPEFREELTDVLTDTYDQIVGMIAKDRKLSTDKVKELVDNGAFTAKQAKDAGLIDEIGYEDELYTAVKDKFEGATVKLIKSYGKKKSETDLSGLNGIIALMNALSGEGTTTRKSSAPKIGVLYASGPIMTGNSSSGLLSGETMGSDTMIKAIRAMKDDTTVKAVVIRVDSPGGSALASDLMWHELEELKKKKPLVASMSDVAGSGGYYIAMGAQKIYAAPGTITGSIGVVGGKLAFEKLYEKVGVHVVTIEKGKNSGLLSLSAPMTDDQKTAMKALMFDIYQQFTSKAAAGRGMEVEKLEKLARGRIYSGKRAKELHLIDEVGTLGDAIKAAQVLAGLKPEDKLERLELPHPASPLEALLGDMKESQSRAMIEKVAGPALDSIRTLNVLSEQPVITIMPYKLQLK